jgi:hypothetical protein
MESHIHENHKQGCCHNGAHHRRSNATPGQGNKESTPKGRSDITSWDHNQPDPSGILGDATLVGFDFDRFDSPPGNPASTCVSEFVHYEIGLEDGRWNVREEGKAIRLAERLLDRRSMLYVPATDSKRMGLKMAVLNSTKKPTMKPA